MSSLLISHSCFYFSGVALHSGARQVIRRDIIIRWSAYVISAQGYLKEWSESNGRHYQAWVGGYVALGVVSFITRYLSRFLGPRVVAEGI
jgi:hypothetical protein